MDTINKIKVIIMAVKAWIINGSIVQWVKPSLLFQSNTLIYRLHGHKVGNLQISIAKE